MSTTVRRRVVVDNRQLAAEIGARIKQARLRSSLTQQQLAGERYTKAYISALEHGIAKPSMAALDYLAARLGTNASALLQDPDRAWVRVEADLHLAAGRWMEALDGYQALLESAVDQLGRAELLAGIAEALCRLNRPAEALAPAAEAGRIFGQLGRETDRLRAEYWLGSAHHQRDNPTEARAILGAILQQIRGGLDMGPDFLVRLLIGLAVIESAQGENATALAYLEEARGLTDDLDDRRRGAFLFSLAQSYRQAGDTEAAIRAGHQARALFRAAEADLQVVMAENGLALAYLQTGSAERARETIRHARAAGIAGSDPSVGAHLADTEARIALAGGETEQAIALADQAIDLANASDNSKALLDALVTRARALATAGRHEEAITSFERAAELARAIAAPSRVREVLSAWADTLAAAGRPDEAYALAREALAAR